MKTSFNRRHSRLGRSLSWLVVAGLTTAALIGPGAGGALAVTNYATVSGYAPGTPENNDAGPKGPWGSDCTKEDSVDGSLGSTFLLPQGYVKVIVKAGSEQSAPGHVNTIFNNPSAGQTVWADSNGSGVFDDGDKGISHIIFCGPIISTT